MGELLQLPAPKKKEPTLDWGAVPHYFCLTCNTDQFRILPQGEIWCANCGQRMGNLKARELWQAK